MVCTNSLSPCGCILSGPMDLAISSLPRYSQNPSFLTKGKPSFQHSFILDLWVRETQVNILGLVWTVKIDEKETFSNSAFTFSSVTRILPPSFSNRSTLFFVLLLLLLYLKKPSLSLTTLATNGCSVILTELAFRFP